MRLSTSTADNRKLERRMTHSFELLISEGNGNEICSVEIEAVATIYPSQPQGERSYASGGEPAEEGHAEITALQFYDQQRNVTRDVSSLLHILPQQFIDDLEVLIYEDRATEAADRADFEREKRDEAALEALHHNFAQLVP